MSTFLAEQVEKIFDRHRNEINQLWQKIVIIIPNKRAAVYLQKHIAQCSEKPVFLPEILTINEWISNHTEEKILTSTELLFIFYEVYREIEGDEAKEFEEFSQWAPTILADFDEIDRYLIPPKQLFKNLRDIKVLESWDPSGESLSEGQEKFKKLWDKLPRYYEALNKRLAKEKATYSGKSYQHFLETIDQLDLTQHFYFLGFNALSRSEKEIMQKLRKQEKATVLFDVDKFYLDNPAHEAGHFYREIKKEWALKEDIPKNFNQTEKQFQVIETSQQTTQAKIAGDLVKKLLDNNTKLDKTAIVLADESLLLPLTKSLPIELKEVNITMGWPIRFSHLKGLLDILFDLQFNFQKFGGNKIYHKTLKALLQHPYILEIIGNQKVIRELEEMITDRNMIFTSLDELTSKYGVFTKFAAFLTPLPSSTHDKVAVFGDLTELLFQTFEGKSNRKLDLEILFQFDKGLRKFKVITEPYQPELSLATFKRLFYQFWQNESISFLGNPIDGLQLMGILETRALDFENLIILGMNEGNLPRTNISNTFIPRDLRQFEKQLPTEEDRQAIFAHHFYRLLQRAKNIYMTFNSTTDKMNTGEQSRFIRQLAYEVDLSKHQFKSSVYSPEDKRANTKEVIYPSTNAVHKRLDEIFEKGLSPSAFNKLISCPLDFYYRYVLNFEELDEVEEQIEASTFGSRVHTVLEKIIKDNFKTEDGYLPLSIDVLVKESKPQKIRKRLEEAYLNPDNPREKKFRKSDLQYGQNKLSFDVSARLIRDFVELQIKELKQTTDAIIPIELEKKINGSITIEVQGKKKIINIQGNADRIDKIGGLYRIIDYKTGKCDEDRVSISKKMYSTDDLSDFVHHNNKGYARQLLMYGLMFRQTYPDFTPFSAGIISMINISSWIQNVKVKGEEDALDQDLLDAFEAEIGRTVATLYETDYTFKHNPQAKYCQHCEHADFES